MIYTNAVKMIHTAPRQAEPSEVRERLHALWSLLNLPKKNQKYLRLAGVCGKSACLELLSSIYEDSPVTVGCLSMPLRAEFRENIRINNRLLSFEEITPYAEQVHRAIQVLKRSDQAEPVTDSVDEEKTPPVIDTEFSQHELLLTVALLIFAHRGCKLCVIEGDGTPHDPTRHLPAPMLLTLCGPIRGEDPEEIHGIQRYARHGILELICSISGEKSYQAISQICAKINCRLTQAPMKDVRIGSMTPRECAFLYHGEEYRTNLCGKFQIQNLILVIETVQALGRLGFPVPREALRERLEGTKLPCRCEILSVSPTIVVDGSHHPSAWEQVCDSLWDFHLATGTRVHLCAPEELADTAREIFSSKGYEVLSVFTLPEEEVTRHLVPQKRYGQLKQIKEFIETALKTLENGDLLYLCGPHNFTARLRHELLQQLGL